MVEMKDRLHAVKERLFGEAMHVTKLPFQSKNKKMWLYVPGGPMVKTLSFQDRQCRFQP